MWETGRMPMTLLLTLGTAFVILAVTAGLTARSRRARPAVMGVGLAALLVGLYLTGLTNLTVNGVASIVAWVRRTVFDATIAWGLGLAVGGVLLFVAGGAFLPKEPKEPKQPKPVKPQSQVSGQQAPAVGAAGKQAPAPAAQPAKGGNKNVDPEDAEIEALLRKRGIM